jgi:hypothetical protein
MRVTILERNHLYQEPGALITYISLHTITYILLHTTGEHSTATKRRLSIVQGQCFKKNVGVRVGGGKWQ